MGSLGVECFHLCGAQIVRRMFTPTRLMGEFMRLNPAVDSRRPRFCWCHASNTVQQPCFLSVLRTVISSVSSFVEGVG